MQPCFTVYGITVAKLNYYLSNYFCKGNTGAAYGDIETLTFQRVKIIHLYEHQLSIVLRKLACNEEHSYQLISWSLLVWTLINSTL